MFFIKGFSMMEQGFFKNNKLILHLKQFLKRSFGVGSIGDNFELREVIVNKNC